MRRLRDIREHRRALRRKLVEQRKKRQKPLPGKKIKPKHVKRPLQDAERLSRDPSIVAKMELNIGSFLDFEDYKPTKTVNICHVIESLGVGGGQTMMMELVKGLDKYYGSHVKNYVVCPRPSHKNFPPSFFSSYGIEPIVMRERELSRFQSANQINIVLQHRLAVSKCLKPFVLSSSKYVLMNHTYHALSRLPNFVKCDYYVSVCNYLAKETAFSGVVHPSRRGVILNGVENDYLADIPLAELKGEFKSGRCHRLVDTKFKLDSLSWLENQSSQLSGHRHYVIGFSPEVRKLCKTLKHAQYLGEILKRNDKMGVLKALDVYFYETFQNEGASIAILESLACGVPVLCKDLGGNIELVRSGINGYVVKDRNEFLSKMKDLHDNPDKLAALKQSTLEDFNNRLHVKHTACRYLQLFEKLLDT